MKRHLTALVFLPLLYLYIARLDAVYFFILLSFVSALALYEFCSMYRMAGVLRLAGILSGVITLALIYFYGRGADVILVSFIAVSVIRLFIKPEPSASLMDIAPAVVGIVYIPGLLSYQLAIRDWGYGWILFLYGSVWAADSLAYYFGKTLRGPKLYKSVSPNKTVAGAIGSAVGGVLGALILRALFLSDMAISQAVVFGAIIGLVTIVGDLVESMFKRDAGVKDSGALIPGHGGILDKIDGVLFAGPAVYWAKTLLHS